MSTPPPTSAHRRGQHPVGPAGSVHIPLHALSSRLDQVPDGPVWVHCAGGFRASIAASMPAAAGKQIVAIDDDVGSAGTCGLAVTAAPAS